MDTLRKDGRTSAEVRGDKLGGGNGEVRRNGSENGFRSLALRNSAKRLAALLAGHLGSFFAFCAPPITQSQSLVSGF